MNAKRPESPASNRMFHTIVLMGSGLALSCGGVAKIEPGSEPSGASGSSNPPSSGGSGNSSGSGNTVGGDFGVGGTITITVGGPGGAGGSAASAGAAGAPIMPNCPFAQWDCTNSATAGFCTYDAVYGIEIGSDCFCNSSRPRSAADCASGFTFTCLDGVQSGATTNTPFQCTCAPTPTDGYLCEACVSGYNADYSCQTQTASEPVLCGCAIVVLK